MKKRLGCLTPGGIAAALFTLAVVGVLSLLQGGGLFSPGALNAQAGGQSLGGVGSHAETGGHCAACHPAPWSGETMADRCLACHPEVAAEMRDMATLHGTLTGEGKAACRDCHPEHRGSEGELTEVDVAAFPHEVTGYSLAGHQEKGDGGAFVCDDCHAEDLLHFELAVCADCHRDLDAAYVEQHLGDFGPDCLPCHDGLDTYGDDFDHDALPFALEGRHEAAACGACHEGARTLADLQAAPTDCVACHAEDDAHEGRFGPDCAACHTAESWEEATFDHALTDFPLTGAHVEVDCAGCHEGDVFQGTPTECVACHAEDDAHEGQFGQDCGACHTAESWEEATFDHALTDFPLTGAHVDVECAGCHEGEVFQGTPADCYACHPDPEYHASLFGTDCAACHDTAAWTPARYDEPHTFPIDHGEEGISPCRRCHPQNLQTYTCYDCHEHDPAEVEREHLEEGIRDFQDCVECHPTGREDEGEGEGGED